MLKHVAMGWAQRLKRVFAIEIDTCERCQGQLRVIASIEEHEVIARMLAHRDRDSGTPEPELAPIAARAPPRQGRPDQPRSRAGRDASEAGIDARRAATQWTSAVRRRQ